MRISDWSSDLCSSDIMATRAIPDAKDRLTTILIAPLMTCSARLPVYALIIAAFIPDRAVGGSPVGLQGLVLFGLSVSGIVGALVGAFVLRRTVARGTLAGVLIERKTERGGRRG